MNRRFVQEVQAVARFVLRIPRMVLVAVLRLYQLLISPVLSALSPSPYGQTCRFYPSCSEYALVAVDRYGVLRGGRLAIWRLLRCNPWNPGGVDHVPSVAGGSDSHLSDQAKAAPHPATAERLSMAGADTSAEHATAVCDRHAA